MYPSGMKHRYVDPFQPATAAGDATFSYRTMDTLNDAAAASRLPARHARQPHMLHQRPSDRQRRERARFEDNHRVNERNARAAPMPHSSVRRHASVAAA